MSVFRQEYRELTEEEKQRVLDIKTKAEELYELFDASTSPREMALAKTKLEESVMWAVKGVTA